MYPPRAPRRQLNIALIAHTTSVPAGASSSKHSTPSRKSSVRSTAFGPSNSGGQCSVTITGRRRESICLFGESLSNSPTGLRTYVPILDVCVSVHATTGHDDESLKHSKRTTNPLRYSSLNGKTNYHGTHSLFLPRILRLRYVQLWARFGPTFFTTCMPRSPLPTNGPGHMMIQPH
jgi:hypothetical protein